MHGLVLSLLVVSTDVAVGIMRLDCDLAYGPILVNRRGSRGECGFRAVIDNFLGDRWVYRHLENVFTIMQLGIVNVARQAVDA